MTITETRSAAQPTAPKDRTVRIACALTAVAAVAVVPLMGGIGGDTGAEATQHLVDHAGRMQGAAILAVLVAAGLVLAAVRFGTHLSRGLWRGSSVGVVAISAGVAVAMLYAAYYASFGAGVLVASFLLDEPGPGVGESTLVLINLVEVTRYAPGLVLVGAAVAARQILPRTIWVSAAVLLVMTLTPFTSWIAAVAIPIWLALAAASRPGGVPAQDAAH